MDPIRISGKKDGEDLDMSSNMIDDFFNSRKSKKRKGLIVSNTLINKEFEEDILNYGRYSEDESLTQTE